MPRLEYIDGNDSRRYQEKIFRRRRIVKARQKSKRAKYSHRYDRNLLEIFFPSLLKKFSEFGFIDEQYLDNRGYIAVPATFSLKDNFDQTIIVFKQMMSEFVLGKYSVIFDFSVTFPK